MDAAKEPTRGLGTGQENPKYHGLATSSRTKSTAFSKQSSRRWLSEVSDDLDSLKDHLQLLSRDSHYPFVDHHDGLCASVTEFITSRVAIDLALYIHEIKAQKLPESSQHTRHGSSRPTWLLNLSCKPADIGLKEVFHNNPNEGWWLIKLYVKERLTVPSLLWLGGCGVEYA